MAESDFVKESCFAHFQETVDVILSEDNNLAGLMNHSGVVVNARSKKVIFQRKKLPLLPPLTAYSQSVH